MDNTSDKRIDKLLVGVSMLVVFFVTGCLYFLPESSLKVAKSIFNILTDIFGAPVLLLTFIGLIVLVFLAFTKYGKIQLGEGKPEFSTFSWVAMMISCGLGSATVYWAFIEWAYYIGTPGLGIAVGSKLAYEMSVTYSMFHWGFSAWALYAMVGLPIAYHFYVKRNEGLSLSAIVSAITGIKTTNAICRIVDILFMFICFGGLSITLGLSTPLVTMVICDVLGIEASFIMNVVLIIMISIVYSFSSYIGIKKGMAKISDWNIKLMILFIITLALLGPTLFIMSNFVNSFGLMLQNFIHMSLFTDPIAKSGFPEAWTIFYWLYWITYAPFTGVFIAKVSKGRSIRSVVANTILSGSAGCFLFFGVLGSLSMQRSITKVVNVVDMLNAGQDNAAIVQILRSLPGGPILMIIFCISTILFLATTLDGAAYTMSTTTTVGLRNNEEPNPMLRLFWCIMLSLVPLTMIFIKANLNTIKTCAIITAIPIVFIMALLMGGWIRWMIQDYGSVTTLQIEKEAQEKIAKAV
ncbi:BCCT family transporter [Synergistes jonesii]|uniref:BCCT family transporter n=1 Tax=Synergistes jonesii TaxID=2754 RepID=UPI00056B17A9|nr:BCCT family transporter [Synergistes jonesii]OFB61384.1 glycine/betaine ABC transporter [Synergistes jonesii]OFB65338.1 glycine/betaine ABC transporter [Synergistes jonesii]OFB68688.1 glycine/betaine ABC transporter [Synergistes jonesii]OFB69354.1 glycine/betaine ABC transporter [Synergistes jonesii]OFB77015.1 glycine/betaine ABC transporter [Synergistes jonesii]